MLVVWKIEEVDGNIIQLDVKMKKRNQKHKKLNKEKVKEIKKLLQENNLTLQKIANIYNVHVSTISDIKHKRIWRDIS